MKRIILTILISSSFVKAQIDSNGILGGISAQTGGTLNTFLGKLNNSNSGNNSKVFLFSDFKTAIVDGYQLSDKYRYNGLTDNFEYIKDDNLYALVKIPDLKINFVHDSSKYQFKEYLDNSGNTTQRFLKILVDDPSKNSLFKSFEASEVINENKNSYTGLDHTKIVVKSNYIIVNKNGSLLLPKNNKKLSELLGVNVDELIKSNKLNIKKEEDLIKLINLANK